mmetsp:Transcript_10627/g.20892  ORF Transcript_10627/g.20892 Transcript_10627/m.20892 type:complete len:1085 (-) Transcript_10627:448-3702(-)
MSVEDDTLSAAKPAAEPAAAAENASSDDNKLSGELSSQIVAATTAPEPASAEVSASASQDTAQNEMEVENVKTPNSPKILNSDDSNDGAEVKESSATKPESSSQGTDIPKGETDSKNPETSEDGDVKIEDTARDGDISKYAKGDADNVANDEDNVKMEDAEMESKSTKKEDIGPLAKGWVQLETPEGEAYYHHKASGAIRWQRPTEDKNDTLASSKEETAQDKDSKKDVDGDDVVDNAVGAEKDTAGDTIMQKAEGANDFHSEQSVVAPSPRKRKVGDDDDVEVAIEDMSKERRELQARLSAKDAILDPRVKGWMAEWLRRDGEDLKRRKKRERRDVDLLVEMLASGYDGYAEYTALVVRWLGLLEQRSADGTENGDGTGALAAAASTSTMAGGAAVGHTSAGKNSHNGGISNERQLQPPQQQEASVMGALDRQLSGTMLLGKDEGAAGTLPPPPPSVVDYLSKLVDQQFQKDKLMDMMEEDLPPAWLRGMLHSTEWRMTLIRLADKHKTVPLLDFAVRAMCKEGHHNEVAQVMNPANYFAVFRRTFTDLLREILDCEDGRGNSPTELSKLEERFRELAGHSQFTYLFAMEALEALEGSDDGLEGVVAATAASEGPTSDAVASVLASLQLKSTLLRAKVRRLRQGLLNVPRKQDAVEQGRAEAIHLCKPINRRNVGGLSASPACGGFPALANLLRTCLKDRMFKPEAFMRLRAIYDPERNHQASLVPLWPLRRLEVILLLVTQLFDPFRSMEASCIEDGAYITAVAAARVPGKGLEREVYVALVDAIKVCKDSKTMSMEALQVDSQSIQMLTSLVADFPIVSSGVIRFARNCMMSSNFQKEKYFFTGMRVMLHLIRCAVRAHPLQRIMAFFAICQALPMNPAHIYQSKLLEIKKLMVDELIFLIESGFIFQVLEFVRNQASLGRMDAPLVCHFVVELAKTVGSNLSPEFAKAVLQLVTLDACVRAVRAAHNREHLRLVNELRTKCQNTVTLASTMPSSAVSSSVMQYAATSSPTNPGAPSGGSAGAVAGGSSATAASVSNGNVANRMSSVTSAASAAAAAAARGGAGNPARRREKISLVPFRPK